MKIPASYHGSSLTPGGRRPRVAYLSGPIDALKVARELKEDRQPDYYGTVYLAQLFGVLEALHADCLVITTLPGKRGRKMLGSIRVTNIPMSEGLAGPWYHLAMMRWSVSCITEILRFRPQVAILTAGQNYFWIFAGLRLFAVRLFVSLHCTLWPKLAPQRPANRLLNRLNGRYFFPACDHVQAVSQDIVDQVLASSTRLRAPPRKFVPTYRAENFTAAKSARYPDAGTPFRLLYVGRIEENKGVFDLVEMMRTLEELEPGRYRLTICGTGSANHALADAVSESRLGRSITIAGQRDAVQLAAHYAECHVVVVPTRSTFEEGYAKVAAEAVLNLRPVITSAACPALADVADAAIEARVDDPAAYIDAIRNLATDPILYAEKVAAAARVRQIYVDQSHSYRAVIEPALRTALSV